MANCLEQFTAVDGGNLTFRRTQAACRRVLPGLAHLLLCAVCMGAPTPSAWAQWQGRDLADLSLEELSQVEVATPASAPQDSQQTKDLTELSPEELTKIQVATVTTASKYVQKVTEAPTSASVITADDIQRYGYRTLVDILNSVPGFYVSNDRNYSYFGARGFLRPGDYNSRVLVLIDGHRLNDDIFDSVLAGTEFQLDADLIDHVEVVRGPTSSLYGTDAFFGVVNVITKRGQQLQGVEVSNEAASFGSYTGRASYGAKLHNDLEMLYSGSVYDSHGHDRLFFPEFASPATNNGIAENADSDHFRRFFADLSYRGFTLQGAYSSREKAIPTASFGTVFNDARTRTIDSRGYMDLKYEHTFAGGLAILSRVYSDHYDYHGTYIYDVSQTNVPQLAFNQDLALGDWWGGEVQATKKLWSRHRVAVGLGWRDEFREDETNFNENPFVLYQRDRRGSSDWGLYLQDEFRIGKDLILSAGVRRDYYYSFGTTTNPRLALIYSPLRKTTFKALYGTAFRAPSTYEQYYSGFGNQASPALKPETIKTGELIWEQYWGEHLRLSASGFQYWTRDLINQGIDPVTGNIFYQNIGSVRTKGAELELEGRWPGHIKGRISYSYQDATDEQAGQPLSNSPRHLGKFNLTAPLLKRALLGGLEVQYVGRRDTLSDNSLGSFAIVNATLLAQSLPKGLEFSASVYNLFDHAYAVPGGAEHRQDAIPQDGRSFRVKLNYRYLFRSDSPQTGALGKQ